MRFLLFDWQTLVLSKHLLLKLYFVLANASFIRFQVLMVIGPENLTLESFASLVINKFVVLAFLVVKPIYQTYY